MFGSLFSSDSRTDSSVRNILPTAGQANELVSGLVLNFSDQRNIEVGKRGSFNDAGPAPVNVNVNASDHGAIAAGFSVAELALASNVMAGRDAFRVAELSIGANLAATEDALRFGGDAVRAIERSEGAFLNTLSDMQFDFLRSSERVVGGALAANETAVLGALSASDRATASALREVGNVTTAAFDNLETTTVGVFDQLSGVIQNAAEGIQSVAERAQTATGGELADTIKAMAWPIGLAFVGLIFVSRARA